jgi:carbon starvation protein
LSNRYIATAFVVISAAVLAFASGADGKGALTLWPLFGAVNQTLAALSLIIVTLYLKRLGGWKWFIAGLPALFMAVMTLWASIINQVDFMRQKDILLVIINAVIIFIVVWIIVEGLITFFKQTKQEVQTDPSMV